MATIFGMGIVATPSDFGNQGSLPTHPELLDWLAVTFVEEGWDIKKMIKRIVMSATYQQSSKSNDLQLSIDPKNQYLSVFPRQKLTAEMIRDNVLVSSGLFVDRLGGPSVKPYQPPGLWDEMTGGSTSIPSSDILCLPMEINIVEAFTHTGKEPSLLQE